MKKTILAFAVIVLIAAPAFAAEEKNSMGINYGSKFSGVWGFEGEFDVSSRFNKAPISLQVFWKTYSRHYYEAGVGDYKYNYMGVGGALIYDFSSAIGVGARLKPYAGLGFMDLNEQAPETTAPLPVTDSKKSGLYGTAGIRYAITKRIAADLSYNNYTGATLGVVLGF